MSTNIEIESKALVSELEFKKILKSFKDRLRPTYSHTNYYIDSTTHDLISHGIVLRIREREDTDAIITLKTPMAEGLLEKNQTLKADDLVLLKETNKLPDGDIKRFLTTLGFKIDNLKILSQLKTIRSDVEYKNGLLSFDENHYNNKVDYEIEFEFTSQPQAEKIMEELLQEFKILYTPNKKSKVLRALDL